MLRGTRQLSFVNVGARDVLGTETDSDEARAHPAQERCAFQQAHRPRNSSGFGLAHTTKQLLFENALHALCKSSGKQPAALYSGQMVESDRAVAKRPCQYVTGGDSVLNR